MKLKRKILNIFAAVVMVLGSVPMTFANTYADDAPTTDAPANEKKLVDNGDGTYTLSLSVTGKASSSTTQEVTKSNVILLIDTSSSMTTGATGYNGSRLAAEKNALTKNDGIIDKLLANNGNTTETSDIIELYGINFGTGGTRAWDWSTNGTTIKNAINNLSTNSGTNWEEALSLAKAAADTKHAAEPNDNTYIILLTDGQPTTDQTRPANTRHNVNTNYSEEWGYASDDARAIVNAGYTLYGIYTFGPTNIGSNTTCNTANTGGSICLKSLINYAYTGTGNANSALSSDYAQYFYDATDTQALIDALEAIVNEISSSVGYTNIAINDGLTDLTSSMKVDGKISNLTYTRSGGSYGSGTVWTDAPEATTTNGSINWNLGSTVLEDGVTYTVSFLVWPSQESYDLVADLNNGKRTYDSLSASQKASIIDNDGVYTLKTNTDYPTLTYSTVTTTTSNTGTETVVSTPTTVRIENPKPVGLKNEKLTLEKLWEDDLDPSQREEVEDVVLDLYKDGTKYNDEGIRLDEDNDWKLEDYISIAPGVMISNDSSNYELLKAGHTEYSFGGKKYIILETGHDYYFAEEDINNHFELTNYIYHPMIIDNELKNVFFERDSAGNITGIEEFRKMDSISATNTLKGGINIQKKVVDKNNKEVDTNDSFDITVHLLDADGEDYDYDYRIYYGEKNPEYEAHIVCQTDENGDCVLDGDGNIVVKYSRSEHFYGSGELTETLYIGDTIRIVNVDSGVQYYVEEDEKAGYDTNPTISYKEAYGTGSQVDATQSEDEEGYYVVSGNTASSVTVTNKFLDEKTKVDFEKNWYDKDGNVLSGKELPGSITIELFKKGSDGKKVSTGDTKQITAEDGWKGSFTNLPKYDNGVEIVYSIEESDIQGATSDDEQDVFFEYDSEVNNGKRAVLGKWTWKVKTLEDYIVENTWTPATEVVTGKTSLNIMKVDKTTGKALSGAKFELKLKNGTTLTVTTDADGKATFSNLDSGEYTLKETDAPEGYKLVAAEPGVNITKTKKLNNVDLTKLQNIYEYVFSFSTSEVSGYEYDVNSRTFTVKDEPIPYDDITAAKVWDDDSDRDGLRKNYADYYIAVKNNKGKYVAYEELSLVDKNNYKFTHLPLKTANGEDITYEVVEASTCSGKDDAIKCTEFTGDDDYTVTVAGGVVTNYHKPELYDEKGELTVQKIWAGEGNELARPNTVTIELYANGSRLGEPVTISAANEWKYTFKNLYLNEGGKPIVYTVQESKLGETAFGESENVIVIVSDDGITEGTWTKSENNDKHEVTNTWNRSTAKSLTIKKTVEGLSAEVLSNLEFTIEGPEDFGDNGKMTLKASKDCTTVDEVITCKVSDKVPTGKYTVKESNAEVENFTLTVTGDDGATKKVAKDDEVEFAITNSYEKIRDVHYKVKKIWDDNDDQDGLRPDKLTITLMRKGSGKAEEYRTVELTDDKLEHEWTNLPRADENAVAYTYSVVEEEISNYESDGGKMVGDTFTFTNKHEPATKELKFKKVWNVSGDKLPSVAPTFITVELRNDKNTEKKTIRLDGTGYGEWESDAIKVAVYANQGETITYSVKETKIGNDALGGDNNDTIYVYNGDVLEGKWVAENTDGLTVENTWTPSKEKIEYKGKSKFVLSKVDEDGEAMEGVTFTIGGKDYTTDGNGEITVKVPVSTEKMEESFEYKISEKETWEGYDTVEGSATVTVSCTSEFAKADEDTLTNTYTKNCEFSKKGSEDFAWNGSKLILTVRNNRSLADSITIRKKIEGVKASVLRENGLTFTLSGPDDFEPMEIKFSDFKKISEGVYEYTFDGRIPTGEYKVVESGAEVEYFTVMVTGNDEAQAVEKEDDAVFEIVNEYVVENTSYAVVKIWNDAHNKDGKRPDELEVRLLANGEVTDTVYVSMDDAVIIGEEDEEYSTGDVWVYVWEELPMADEYAELISYTAEEVLESDDYEQTDMEGDEYYTLFVNSHQLDDPCANGGCGGDIIPPVTPETGRLTVNEELQSSQGAVVDNTFVLVVLMGVSTVALYGAAKFAKRK